MKRVNLSNNLSGRFTLSVRDVLESYNPAAPERSQVIGKMKRLSAAGDWERYAVLDSGEGRLSRRFIVTEKFEARSINTAFKRN